MHQIFCCCNFLGFSVESFISDLTAVMYVMYVKQLQTDLRTDIMVHKNSWAILKKRFLLSIKKENVNVTVIF